MGEDKCPKGGACNGTWGVKGYCNGVPRRVNTENSSEERCNNCKKLWKSTRETYRVQEILDDKSSWTAHKSAIIPSFDVTDKVKVSMHNEDYDLAEILSHGCATPQKDESFCNGSRSKSDEKPVCTTCGKPWEDNPETYIVQNISPAYHLSGPASVCWTAKASWMISLECVCGRLNCKIEHRCRNIVDTHGSHCKKRINLLTWLCETCKK